MCLNSARRQKCLFSPFRSAVIWKVEEHARNRVPESRVVAPAPAPPTAQQASSNLPAPPPVTDAARHRFGFRVVVCLFKRLYLAPFVWVMLSGALKLFGIGRISFPSSFGICCGGLRCDWNASDSAAKSVSLTLSPKYGVF